jgi:hypothetical protein
VKSVLVILSAAVALATSATSSDAQCNFARPRQTKARHLELAMVPAYEGCNEPGGGTPNTTSEGGIPACAPPRTEYQHIGGNALNAWVWGPTTYAKVEVNASTYPKPPADPNDPLNPVGDTSDIQVKLWVRDVMNDGAGFANSTGELCMVARMTIDDRANGDQTWVDFPACFSVTLMGGDNASVGAVYYSYTDLLNTSRNPVWQSAGWSPCRVSSSGTATGAISRTPGWRSTDPSRTRQRAGASHSQLISPSAAARGRAIVR